MSIIFPIIANQAHSSVTALLLKKEKYIWMERNVTSETIAVVLDDHRLFASTFAMLLERTHFFSNVYTFSVERDAIRFIVDNMSAKVWFFMDYFMPGVNPHYLISDVSKLVPSAKMAVVSNITNLELIRKIMASKVHGIISKSDGVDEIIAYLQSSPGRSPYLSNTISALLKQAGSDTGLPKFTSRELEVLSLISSGRNIDEIADRLSLSKHTVITYRRNMLTKSGFRSITELVAYSIRSGIVSIS